MCCNLSKYVLVYIFSFRCRSYSIVIQTGDRRTDRQTDSEGLVIGSRFNLWVQNPKKNIVSHT